MSNNANGNKRVIYFSSVAWCYSYGDNDFIMRTFDFIARSDATHVTCSTDTDFRVTCSKKMINCMQLQSFPSDSYTFAVS